MFELATLFSIGLMASALPGPDILYISRTALDRGIFAGWVAASAVLFASLFYLTAAGLGLGVLGHNPYFRLFIGGFGSIYLLWIAKGIWNETMEITKKHDKDGRYLHLFFKGMAVHLSNPKAIIFFSVVLAPFLSKGSLVLQITVITIAHATTFFCTAYLISKFDNFFTPKRSLYINRASAILFSVFAIELLRNSWEALNIILANN